MQFTETTISAIKSISQRSLAIAWQNAARGARFPRFADFRPSSRSNDPRYLVIWNVEERADGRIFRAMYQGAVIETAFRSPWAGRSMADVVPEPLRAPALAAANHCTDTGRAAYMIYTTRDNLGRRLDCERLLLPFGSAQTGVRQLIASNEPISLDGDIVLDQSLDHFTAGYEILLAGQFPASSDRSESQISSLG